MLMYSDKVLEFATTAHKGQVRKFTGIPYITHPIAVANIAFAKEENNLKRKNLYGSPGLEYISEYILSIGYLHDVLEDTSVTEKQLEDFLGSVAGVYASGILLTVKLLTKSKKNFDLFKYLEGIKHDPFAKIFKLADLQHNMSDLKDTKKLDHYKLIKYYLEN